MVLLWFSGVLLWSLCYCDRCFVGRWLLIVLWFTLLTFYFEFISGLIFRVYCLAAVWFCGLIAVCVCYCRCFVL